MLPRPLLAGFVLLIVGGVLFALTTGSDDSSGSRRVTSAVERTAVGLERQAAQNTSNEKLLLGTMRTWIRAGAEQIEAIYVPTDPIPSGASADYRAGLRAWNSYLSRTNGEASEDTAEMASGTYFQLVEIGSTSPAEATANAAGAVRAQKIVCKHEANLFTLSNLATYQYFTGENTAGDKAARKAALDIRKSKRGIVTGQLNAYKERGEKFVARVRRGFKTLEETGDDALETPIKGYGAPAGLNGHEPGGEPG